jgi:GNAT superfamily N-acetyltransferase
VPEAVLRLLVELRTTFLDDELLAALRAQARELGYLLYAAEVASTPVGLIGFRPVQTLARGRHLHVDDLVVTRDLRGRGIGRRLLSFVESRAEEAGLRAVYLDSPPEVLDFSRTQGYDPHEALLMRKRL